MLSDFICLMYLFIFLSMYFLFAFDKVYIYVCKIISIKDVKKWR